MASIYARLGFDFTPANSDILTLSTDAEAHLNSMPRLLSDWQVNDIGNSDIGNYFKNPVANVHSALVANTTIIYTLANTDPANTWTESNLAQDLADTASNFLIELAAFKSHTDNVSGVNNVESGGDVVNDFPYYDTATGVGRFLVYITHESDGVLNSSPIIGSMTSLLINEELVANSIIISNDIPTINASLSGGIYTLSASAINVIISHIQTANNFIGTRKNHDINFYRNSRAVLSDYSAVNKFSNMGETNTKLIKDYIGTDKIVTRLNS
jgi:hypothetical protein